MPASLTAQRATLAAAAASATHVFTPAASIPAGTALALFIGCSGAPSMSIADDGGNPWAFLTTAANGTTDKVGLAFVVTTAPLTSVTVTLGASQNAGGALWEVGSLAASPADQVSSGTGTGTAMFSGATPGLSQADEFGIGAFVWPGTAAQGTFTAGSGWSQPTPGEAFQSSSAGSFARWTAGEYDVLASTAGVTASATNNNSGAAWGAVVATFLAQSGPPATAFLYGSGRYGVDFYSTPVLALTLSIDDTATVADAVQRDAVKSLADTATTADATSSANTKVMADSATTTDALAQTTGKNVVDTATVADAQAKDSQKALSDALGLAETISPAQGVSTQVDDSVGVADAQTPQSGKEQIVADAAGVADSTQASRGFGQAVNDTANTVDQITTQAVYQRTLTEALGVTDATRADVQAAVQDALSVADALVRAIATLIQETVAADDSVSPQMSGAIQQSISDTATLADVVITAAVTSRVLADTATVADATITARGLVQPIGDNAGVADALAFTKGVNVTLAEVIDVGDVVAAAVAKALNDALGVQDTATPEAANQLTQGIADVLGVIDTLDAKAGRGLILTDNVGVADLLTHLGLTNVLVVDALSVEDTTRADAQAVIDDLLTAVDDITPASSYTFDLHDDLTVADLIQTYLGAIAPLLIALAATPARVILLTADPALTIELEAHSTRTVELAPETPNVGIQADSRLRIELST